MRPIAPRSVPSGEDGAGQPHEFSSQRVPAAPAPADRGSGSRQVRDRHVDDVRVNDDGDRKSTRLNSSHSQISYAVFCLKKKQKTSQYSYGHRDILTITACIYSLRSLHEIHELFQVDAANSSGYRLSCETCRTRLAVQYA